MRIYRLHRAHRSASDYGGSLLYPGRWNQKGTPVLYFSLALSLACPEQLVHLTPDEMPDDYVYTSVDLRGEPEAADYRGSLMDVDSTRRYGHRWATDRRSLAILVPSVIIPIEFNLLLNPLHVAFTDLEWGEPQPFAFDPRLLNRSSAGAV
jgi:RES domain-containing protein